MNMSKPTLNVSEKSPFSCGGGLFGIKNRTRIGWMLRKHSEASASLAARVSSCPHGKRTWHKGVLRWQVRLR